MAKLGKIRHSTKKAHAARYNASAKRVMYGREITIKSRIGYTGGPRTKRNALYAARTCINGANSYTEPGRCATGYASSPTLALKRSLAKMAKQIR